MANTQNPAKVTKYFKGNLNAKEVFQTSDKFLFNKKQDAKAHAKTLKDQNVAVFTNKVKTEAKKAEATDTKE